VREVKRVPNNPSAKVFHKTFNVFDPNPERSKTIHRFLVVLPLATFVSSVVLTVLFIEAFKYGLMLSLMAIIVCLNLIVIEDLIEVYKITDTFTKAIHKKAKFGVGDVRIFHMIKKPLEKACNYYLSLTISFMLLALALPQILHPALGVFSNFTGTILTVSAQTGNLAPLITPLLLALLTVLTQILVKKAKSKFLGNLVTEKAVS
jgi:hypothetical protein